MKKNKTIVNSWNEWDPLKHAIVGRADGTCIPAPEPALDAKVPEDSDMRGQFGPRTKDTVNKAKQLLDDGATSIALLLDDIPEDFENKFGNQISEGTSHGILANTLSEKLGKNIYFVPRIYSDELIEDEHYYIKDLSTVINQRTKIFYCGKNVVSKN